MLLFTGSSQQNELKVNKINLVCRLGSLSDLAEAHIMAAEMFFPIDQVESVRQPRQEDRRFSRNFRDDLKFKFK